MIVEESVYQGKPVLSIKKEENDKFLFSFGYMKAKMIVESIDQIKAFVEKCEASNLTKGNK